MASSHTPCLPVQNKGRKTKRVDQLRVVTEKQPAKLRSFIYLDYCKTADEINLTANAPIIIFM